MPIRLLIVLSVIWAVAILGVTALLGSSDPADPAAQVLGSTAILAAILFCLVASVLAARRSKRARLGWILIAVGMGLGAVGQLGWVATALSETQATPSALADTLGFLGYFLPTVAAVFAFPRRSELLISRLRQVLDVLVITIGVILISEATVLGTVLEVTDTTTLAGWLHLSYLVADIAICALVLCLGMRQLPGDRITWFVLGSGLLVVAVSDSIYVSLLAYGQTNLLATPLAAGWMLGPVLIGLAAFIPMTGRVTRGRDYTLVLQLLPYGPVVGALLVLVLSPVSRDPFLLVTAFLLLLTVACRQVMIVYENVSLTRDLEAKVASRTAELTTLGSIVTSSTDAIVGVSQDNRITTWNPAAALLYGFPATEVIGQSPKVLLPEAGPLAKDLIARAERGEQLDGYEIDWQRPDGSTLPIAMTVSPIVGADGVEGISVFARDVTQRRREAEALERAREEALASSRLKSEFLATMSHEIRTPMNAVIGLTSLLLETELDRTQRTYAEGVQSAGDALLGVIDDILDFSKLEAGKVVLDQQDFSPRRLVEEVGALMAPAASAKGLELIAYCLPGVPAAVHGDAGRIRQILLNLASNAVKFTPQGEVVIKVAAANDDRDRTRLRFDVIDTGIGIAAKDQGRLFESFSQADASTTRRFGGTGLGLAISRRLVEVMGGSIGLESEVDVGSTFSFELTLRTAPKPEPSSEELSHDLLVGLRVLVVDDNATNRTLLQAQLGAWQMHTDLADAAPRAFEILRTAALQGQPYDIITLDAHMPEVDGLDLARRVTADPVLEGSSMIMLTSGLYPEPQTMRDAGLTQWLPKPDR
ncbi:MAG TPA: ATP-binding protein, partial [Microlunatus sp.]|nr:ATP-binding protein [Microlunatus sp.]